MKILHYSDLASAEFWDLYQQCDVLVATGDLQLFDFGRLQDTEVARKPAFGVYGNHDSGMYMPQLGIINLHNQIQKHAGFSWGGFQGCLRYKDGNAPMFTESEAEEFAKTFPYVDILLLHAGPEGMLDDTSDTTHKGSGAIRKYVLEKKPKFVFLGHQYSNAEMEIEGTKLFRTYGARIIEI